MERGIFDASIRTLHNGLKLITIKKDTQLTAIHTAVNIGSLYEKDDEKGIAHFIEHMLFKGTESRNNEWWQHRYFGKKATCFHRKISGNPVRLHHYGGG